MPAGGESIEAVVARIDERVAGLVQRFDTYTETEVLLRADIALAKDEARADSSAVRVDLERQIQAVAVALDKHERAVNPHPNQENWLRRSTDKLTVAIEGLREDIGEVRTEISAAQGTFRGAGKALYPLLLIGSAAISAVLTHILGR